MIRFFLICIFAATLTLGFQAHAALPENCWKSYVLFVEDDTFQVDFPSEPYVTHVDENTVFNSIEQGRYFGLVVTSSEECSLEDEQAIIAQMESTGFNILSHSYLNETTMDFLILNDPSLKALGKYIRIRLVCGTGQLFMLCCFETTKTLSHDGARFFNSFYLID